MTAILSVTKYGVMKLPEIKRGKKPPPTDEELEKLSSDIESLDAAGLSVKSIDTSSDGEPRYSILPKEGLSIAEWRYAMERRGFECISNLTANNLGFIAVRATVKGTGWS